MADALPKPIHRRLDPEGRYGLRLTLLALAVLLVAIPFGVLLDQVVRDGPLVRVDTAAANHLHGWTRDSPGAVRALRAVSFIGSPPWIAVMVAAAAGFALRRRRVRLAVFLVLTTVAGGIIDTAVKVAVDRDRPSLEEPVATAHGQSFPSGHSMSSTVAYGALLLVLLPAFPERARRPAVVGAVVAVLAVGFSRLALGVHFISDVVGGYALGLAWLAASTAAFSVWRVERGRPKVEPLEGLEPEAAADLG